MTNVVALNASSTAAIATAPAVNVPITVDVSRYDSRCDGWALLVEAKHSLPAPGEFRTISDLRDSHYLTARRDVELFEGDAVLLGEANHHRKPRGWFHRLHLNYRGDWICVEPNSEIKAAIKKAIIAGTCTAPIDILRGNGETVAMVRILHAIRAGFDPRPFDI